MIDDYLLPITTYRDIYYIQYNIIINYYIIHIYKIYNHIHNQIKKL